MTNYTVSSLEFGPALGVGIVAAAYSLAYGITMWPIMHSHITSIVCMLQLMLSIAFWTIFFALRGKNKLPAYAAYQAARITTALIVSAQVVMPLSQL